MVGGQNLFYRTECWRRTIFFLRKSFFSLIFDIYNVEKSCSSKKNAFWSKRFFWQSKFSFENVTKNNSFEFENTKKNGIRGVSKPNMAITGISQIKMLFRGFPQLKIPAKWQKFMKYAQPFGVGCPNGLWRVSKNLWPPKKEITQKDFSFELKHFFSGHMRPFGSPFIDFSDVRPIFGQNR